MVVGPDGSRGCVSCFGSDPTTATTTTTKHDHDHDDGRDRHPLIVEEGDHSMTLELFFAFEEAEVDQENESGHFGTALLY